MANEANTYDVVIVGAGFAGLYALYKFRSLGYRCRVLEAGSGVGGVWYWNRYPGARCDVESVDYSYGFSEELQQEWTWTERYASQPEIRAYLDHVADRFDLRPDIQLNTFVKAARIDSQSNKWRISTGQGQELSATYCIMATGPLSVPIKPDIPGLEQFEGPTYYTSSWPEKGVDFNGLSVGLVGTGSSGVQATPVIAESAAQLTVFQRTPNYSVPARNEPLNPAKMADVKARYPELRAICRRSGFGNSAWSAEQTAGRRALEMSPEHRDRIFEEQWALGGPGFLTVFPDLMTNPQVNETAGEFVRRKIREAVEDPAVADALTPPDDQLIGCKRICVDTDYFVTFNRPNVSLVDVKKDRIIGIEAKGLRTENGFYPLDALVLATGFDALTGALVRIDIRGVEGMSLREKWEHGPLNYLGMAVSGFPNLFIINGPGSPSVTANLVLTSELQVDWLAELITDAEKGGATQISVENDAEDEWVKLVNDIAQQTIFTAGCNSWFVGANVPGKPRLFTAFAGGIPAYIAAIEDAKTAGYRGFSFERVNELERA
ncbi:NAD(P)/FAD-dependent oxidoreductase [Sphingomonas sp. LY54]|uniref:flavin-containing monooxygenase n=1 Tax=Sphingomonas sp. LY54 TaxID=3095343 RepID=UPI002D774894|nr:NAD(P)/FAD-dependent oxidoreductase [Sphingomonas sp. LY54]WRP27717.1 NAD(P)/FAD-dependent oxidoreductase [Sphingomonas sp. LY54]